MSTTIEKPTEALPTTEEVAELKYGGYKAINAAVVAGDFTRRGFLGRLAKWMASDPELVRFRAEARDEREMQEFLINEANNSPLIKPFHGKPVHSIDFDASPGDWIRFLVALDVIPRDSAIKTYRKEMARRAEAVQAEARPTPLSQTIGNTLSRYRSAQQRETWTRLNQLIADASTKGLSDFVLGELVTVADSLGLSDEAIAREFLAAENRS